METIRRAAGWTCVALLAGWEGLRFWWFHGYSNGERTGVVRKLVVKGSPLCKYGEGELALTGAVAGQPVDLWTFGLDDYGDNSTVMKALREVLQALRDLLDWYLERLDRQRAEPAEVQDIPIL